MAARTSTISAQSKKGMVTVRPGRNGQGKPSKPGGAAARPRKTKVKSKTLSEERHIPAVVIKFGLVIVALGIVFVSYKVVAASSVFAIKKFEVAGNLHASEDEI